MSTVHHGVGKPALLTTLVGIRKENLCSDGEYICLAEGFDEGCQKVWFHPHIGV